MLGDLGDLYLSEWYYEQLIRLLQDEQLTSLDRNQGSYSFTIGTARDNPGLGGWSAVYLHKPSEQLYYAHYGLALTLHLMGRTEEAENHVHIANDLQTNSSMEADVKQLMQYDIDKLQEEKEQFSDTADHFREEFL